MSYNIFQFLGLESMILRSKMQGNFVLKRKSLNYYEKGIELQKRCNFSCNRRILRRLILENKSFLDGLPKKQFSVEENSPSDGNVYKIAEIPELKKTQDKKNVGSSPRPKKPIRKKAGKKPLLPPIILKAL